MSPLSGLKKDLRLRDAGHSDESFLSFKEKSLQINMAEQINERGATEEEIEAAEGITERPGF